VTSLRELLRRRWLRTALIFLLTVILVAGLIVTVH